MRRLGLTAIVAATAAVSTAAAFAPAAVAAPAGPLAFASAGALVVQPVAGGAPRRVTGPGVSIVGTSRAGGLLALSSGADGDVTITTAGGKVVRRFDFRGIVVHSLDISPDGHMLALTAYRDAEPVPGRIYPYLARINGKDLRRLRTRTRYAYDLRFERSGTSLIYAGAPSTGTEAGCASLRRVRTDGAADAAVYQATRGARPCVVNLSLSPGGDAAAFTGDPDPSDPTPVGSVSTGVYRVLLRGSSVPRLIQTAAYSVAWSPAGDRIAFSTSTGTFRVATTGPPAPVRVSPLPTLSLAWMRGS